MQVTTAVIQTEITSDGIDKTTTDGALNAVLSDL